MVGHRTGNGRPGRAGREVTAEDLAAHLEQYRLGLDAELVLLRRLQEVALRQRAVTEEHDLAALERAADEREWLMAGLVSIEEKTKSVRERLGEAREEVRRLPAMLEVAQLYKTVTEIIAEILETDRDSIRTLEHVVTTRRLAAQVVEQGASTLAAYGRLVMPPPAATLVNRRG
jgi:hypothetical protein